MERTKFRNSENFWREHHSFQEKGSWCGPAVIQMALRAGGIKKSQEEIAKDVLKDWWGTDQRIMLAYLSRYFTKLNYKENAGIRDLSSHLERGHVVIVNWWDDLAGSPPDGHYSVAVKHNKKLAKITLADPSNERNGIIKLGTKEFRKRWFDTLDVRNQIYLTGWMLWLDPNSKVK